MNNILGVFIKIAENEGVKMTALEKIIGASKGVLTRAIKNNTDIQCKWLLSLVENYPQYNPTWILTQKGEMLLKGQEQLAGVSETDPVYNKESNAIEDIIAAKVVERLQPTLDKFQAIDIYLAEIKADELDKKIP